MKRCFIVITTLLFVFALRAQDNTSIPQEPKYIQDLKKPDVRTGAVTTVKQSPAISKMIKMSSVVTRKARGFRVQIYSSNRGAVAREEAFDIEKKLLEKHPNMEVYVTYEAPFWKVRTGNCLDHASAQTLRQWVATEFPEYAPETYIVPSEIQIIE